MRTSVLVVLLALVSAGLVAARFDASEFEIVDQLQLRELDRALVATSSRGGSLREELRVGEGVLHRATRGRVGVAITDKRILAVAVGSGSFQSERLRLRERLVEWPLLGARVGLVLTDLRVLGFDGGSGNFVEQRLGPGEKVVARAIGTSVAVVVTERRALGVSAFAGGFFEVDLLSSERELLVEATGNVATVETPRRLLTFDGADGRWRERRIGLGH